MVLLAEAVTPDGSDLKLTRRDTEYIILANGKSLMSSRMHGSEEALAALATHAWQRGHGAVPGVRQRQRETGRAKSAEARGAYPSVAGPLSVLVGGLGMGFTLRATLDVLPPEATVVVAELLPAVVEWNREIFGQLAGHPLKDRRVRLEMGDVAATLRASRGRFDAVLLDVDNGPTPFTTPENVKLYSDVGIANARAALADGGVLAVWSAQPNRRFEQRLSYGGFTVEVETVRARLKAGGPRHTIFLGFKKHA
jgi:predicted O-methyltransferase YrrM